MSKIAELQVEIRISKFQRMALLAINVPRVLLGFDVIVPAWAVSIGKPLEVRK